MASNAAMAGRVVVVAPDGGQSFWQPRPANGFIEVGLSPALTGFDGFVQGFQTIAPHSHIREHLHTDLVEMLVCIEGAGRLVYDGQERAFAPRTACLIGPGVRHSVVNDADQPLTMLWLQTPPGAEKFFDQVGRPRRPGEPAPSPFERPTDSSALAAASGLTYFGGDR
ncbi:MAG: cupin domain-containing protein [Alphaproteobacteria bacterium]|nr:cupin domain-containing protein [Alphaproteobacteria bacterium]